MRVLSVIEDHQEIATCFAMKNSKRIPAAEIPCDASSAVKDHQRMAMRDFGALSTGLLARRFRFSLPTLPLGEGSLCASLQ